MPTLEFKGKPFVYSHHLSVPFRELRIDVDKSAPAPNGPSLDDNLIIHGDNLEALKALLPRYAGKVDVIYIDPPYNTGNEGWVYNDNVSAPALRGWLDTVVDAEDMERHEKWLSMMWPRLRLLSELLSDRGIIFVSIEETEQSSLSMIMSEVMDADYLGSVPVVNNLKGRNDKGFFARAHEYVVVFARKGFVSLGMPLTQKQLAVFKDFAENGERYTVRDMRKRGGADTREARENLFYPVYFDESGQNASLSKNDQSAFEVFPLKSDGVEGCWKWGKVKAEANLSILSMTKGRGGGRGVGYRLYLNPNAQPPSAETLDEEDEWDEEQDEPIERTAKPKSFWWGPELSTDGAGKELKKIFGDKVFDYPKPVGLIEKILSMSASPEALVLDSFAGSGTTAQAVLAANRLDGGRRRFILIQLPEELSPESSGYKAGYREVIDITAERVRRVIKGVPNAKDEMLREGLGGSFTYCELGEEMNLERFFAGDGRAPAWNRVAEYVGYTATGATLEVGDEGPDGFAGEAAGVRLHLLYRPDQAWMRSNDAMLDMSTAERIKDAAGDKPVLVFAAGKFMAQKALTGIGLTFCQLPYSIHRILGDGNEGVSGVDAA